jgi:uncharacterized membrane protein
MTILYALALCCVPACLLWLSHHQAWAQKLGIIALCYISGLMLGNAGILPDSVAPVQQTLSDVTILLAMPLLLMTLNVRQWRGIAGKAMLSMIIATTSVVTLAVSLFFAFREQGVDSAANFAAMSVGVYTGGTPNLAAIKSGLQIPHNEYIVFHSLDTFVGAVYLLMMLTVGMRWFGRLLGRAPLTDAVSPDAVGHDDSDDYRPFLQRGNLAETGKALSLALLVVFAALGLAQLHALLFAVERNSAVVIVALTGLGIALSLVPRVQRLHLAYKLGMYLIYVFCFVVASTASLGKLAEVDAAIGLFLVGTVVGSLLLHALLCRLARIDRDTFMVTSVAAVCSPPFVPMMARALGNPSAILSGMTAGIIGYALGNFLGISLGLLLQSL